jgi:hypothetical protein
LEEQHDNQNDKACGDSSIHAILGVENVNAARGAFGRKPHMHAPGDGPPIFAGQVLQCFCRPDHTLIPELFL